MNEVTDTSEKKRPRPGFAFLLSVCAVVSIVSGCSRSGMNPASALAVDPVNTSAIQPLSADADILADSAIARDVVIEADTAQFGTPLPWANPETGAAGVITALSEVQGDSGPCRAFSTTRNGFDGIAQFDGRACRFDGKWVLVRFERQDM